MIVPVWPEMEAGRWFELRMEIIMNWWDLVTLTQWKMKLVSID